jgi:hypothetical protein
VSSLITLLISIVKPGEGAWQSVDNRISWPHKDDDDDGRKQLFLRCPDGPGLLAYTGLAEVYPGHTTMADYIRQTLRGDNRTIEGHLAHLHNRLNRDVAAGPWRHEQLIIHVIAFRGGGGPDQADETIAGSPWIYEVANRERAADGRIIPTPGNQFIFKVVEVRDPIWAAGGSGYEHISQSDRHKLTSVLTKKPRTSQDYQRLLAAVNRRTATHGSGVSPWCQTYFLPPSGVGGDSMDHRKPGEPTFSDQRPVPMLVWGIDFTDTAAVLAKQVRLMQEGRSAGDPEFDAFHAAAEEATKRGLRPRR